MATENNRKTSAYFAREIAAKRAQNPISSDVASEIAFAFTLVWLDHKKFPYKASTDETLSGFICTDQQVANMETDYYDYFLSTYWILLYLTTKSARLGV